MGWKFSRAWNLMPKAWLRDTLTGDIFLTLLVQNFNASTLKINCLKYRALKDWDFIPDNFDGQSLMIWTEAWSMIWMSIHMRWNYHNYYLRLYRILQFDTRYILNLIIWLGLSWGYRRKCCLERKRYKRRRLDFQWRYQSEMCRFYQMC